MLQRLQYLAGTFAETPMIASREMRKLLDTDREQFRTAAVALLRHKDFTAGHQYALTLLVTNNLIFDRLSDPNGFEMNEAIEVARRIHTSIDSFLDVKLVRSLIPSGATPAVITDPAAILRVLEVVGAISDGSRVMTLLTQLFQHQDVKVRAKVSLLIGRINRNVQWVEKRLAETDARVRANAVESLWGMDSAESGEIFTTALTDPDNRVAGNGAVGLYRCGDLMAAEALVEMLTREDPKFRATAAWAMGQIADPRFLPELSQRITETESGVRQNVFRAISNIRKRVKQCQDAGPLQLTITRTETMGSRRRLSLTALRNGHHLARLLPTEVVLTDSGQVVNRFSFASRREPDHLAVGFVVPRGIAREDPLGMAWLKAVRVCLRYKRKLDNWATAKYSSTPALAQPTFRLESALLKNGSGGARTQVVEVETKQESEPIRFTSDPHALLSQCETAGLRSAASENAPDAARRMLDAVSVARGYRALFLFVSGSSDAGWAELRARVREAKTVIHCVVASSDVPAELARLCIESGGTIASATTPEEVMPACERAACSLASLYTVEYEIPPSSSGALRIQVCSELGFGEDSITVA